MGQISLLFLLSLVTTITTVPVQKNIYRIKRDGESNNANSTTPFNGCTLDNLKYTTGEEVPSNALCELCICEAPDVICSAIKCQANSGCRVIEKPDQCCPEYKCDCEYNGRIYNNGERLDKPEDPCQVCYCKGSEIMCTSITCYERDDCKPHYTPGQCCPKYDHCPVEPNHASGNSVRSVNTSLYSPKREMQPWLLTKGSTPPTSYGYEESSATYNNLYPGTLKIVEILPTTSGYANRPSEVNIIPRVKTNGKDETQSTIGETNMKTFSTDNPSTSSDGTQTPTVTSSIISEIEHLKDTTLNPITIENSEQGNATESDNLYTTLIPPVLINSTDSDSNPLPDSQKLATIYPNYYHTESSLNAIKDSSTIESVTELEGSGYFLLTGGLYDEISTALPIMQEEVKETTVTNQVTNIINNETSSPSYKVKEEVDEETQQAPFYSAGSQTVSDRLTTEENITNSENDTTTRENLTTPASDISNASKNNSELVELISVDNSLASKSSESNSSEEPTQVTQTSSDNMTTKGMNTPMSGRSDSSENNAELVELLSSVSNTSEAESSQSSSSEESTEITDFSTENVTTKAIESVKETSIENRSIESRETDEPSTENISTTARGKEYTKAEKLQEDTTFHVFSALTTESDMTEATSSGFTGESESHTISEITENNIETSSDHSSQSTESYESTPMPNTVKETNFTSRSVNSAKFENSPIRRKLSTEWNQKYLEDNLSTLMPGSISSQTKYSTPNNQATDRFDTESSTSHSTLVFPSVLNVHSLGNNKVNPEIESQQNVSSMAKVGIYHPTKPNEPAGYLTVVDDKTNVSPTSDTDLATSHILLTPNDLKKLAEILIHERIKPVYPASEKLNVFLEVEKNDSLKSPNNHSIMIEVSSEVPNSKASSVVSDDVMEPNQKLQTHRPETIDGNETQTTDSFSNSSELDDHIYSSTQQNPTYAISSGVTELSKIYQDDLIENLVSTIASTHKEGSDSVDPNTSRQIRIPGDGSQHSVLLDDRDLLLLENFLRKNMGLH